jgi:hypothetical protein
VSAVAFSAVLLVAGVLIYLGIALAYARRLYMTERARIIREEWRRHPEDDPGQRFLTYSRTPIACASFVTGLAWPVLLPGALVVHCLATLITAAPKSTPEERTYRRQQTGRRIAELERELGITDSAADA